MSDMIPIKVDEYRELITLAGYCVELYDWICDSLPTIRFNSDSQQRMPCLNSNRPEIDSFRKGKWGRVV